MKTYIIDNQKMDELNTFSSKIEIMRYTIQTLNDLLWGDVQDGDEDATMRAMALCDVLLNYAKERDEEITKLYHEIEQAEVPAMQDAE